MQSKITTVNRGVQAPNGESFSWFIETGKECTVPNIYSHKTCTEVLEIGSKYFDKTDKWYPEWYFYYGKLVLADRKPANRKKDVAFGNRRSAAMNAIDHVVKIVRDIEEIPLFCYHFIQWVDKKYPELVTPKISGNDYRILDERWDKAEQGELELK